MFLHLQVPGFHAVVHQARTPALRGRPVAVAVDAGLQSPLFATSPEARVCYVEVGMRTDEALRRCPHLQVVTPDPEAYRDAQCRLTALCAAFTPRVGGSAGRLDLDLNGSESLWSHRLVGLRMVDGPGTAVTAASMLRRDCARQLGLNVFIGGGSRLLTARLAATLARGSHLSFQGVTIINPGDEADATDLMPVALLAEYDAHIRALLERCGITTIGQLRALSADEMVGLVGPGGARLYDALHGLHREIVPEMTDAEPSVSSVCRSGEGGAGADAVTGMLHVLARDLALHLHRRRLACTRVTLHIEWCDASLANASTTLRYQTVVDHVLEVAANDLFRQLTRNGVRVARMALTGAGLCAAELQQEWSSGMRAAEGGGPYEAGPEPSRPPFGSTVKRQPH